MCAAQYRLLRPSATGPQPGQTFAPPATGRRYTADGLPIPASSTSASVAAPAWKRRRGPVEVWSSMARFVPLVPSLSRGQWT